MKRITKSILLASAFMIVGFTTAQEVKNTNGVNKKTSTTVQPKTNTTMGSKTDQSMEVRAPQKKTMSTNDADMAMPEKDDATAAQWRKEGLKKQTDVPPQTPATSKETLQVKEKVERPFGEYKVYNKRAAVTNDQEWNRLNEIITNKVNVPNESYAIIKKKREAVKQDFENKKIDGREFMLLNRDLKYAEEDVRKIETWTTSK